MQLKRKAKLTTVVGNHLDGEERAGCFAYFVSLVSRDS